jgi:hypothetical protein
LAVRINQEELLVGVPANAYPSNVRINQLALLLLVPSTLQGSKVQIIGGPFQDALGNALSNGYLVFQLQHDAVALNVGQIMGNMSVRVPLDINGYIQGTVSGAPIYVWPNNVLLPASGTYLIWAYDSSNRLAWDNPQIQSVNSSPSPFNVNAWIPGP